MWFAVSITPNLPPHHGQSQVGLDHSGKDGGSQSCNHGYDTAYGYGCHDNNVTARPYDLCFHENNSLISNQRVPTEEDVSFIYYRNRVALASFLYERRTMLEASDSSDSNEIPGYSFYASETDKSPRLPPRCYGNMTSRGNRTQNPQHWRLPPRSHNFICQRRRGVSKSSREPSASHPPNGLCLGRRPCGCVANFWYEHRTGRWETQPGCSCLHDASEAVARCSSYYEQEVSVVN